MIVDLNDLNPATFFKFEDGTEGGVEIRLIDPETLEDIDSKPLKQKKLFVEANGLKIEKQMIKNAMNLYGIIVQFHGKVLKMLMGMNWNVILKINIF